MSARRTLVGDAPAGTSCGLVLPPPRLARLPSRPFSLLFCSLSYNGKSSDHFKSPPNFSFSYPNRPVLCNSQNRHLPAVGGFSPHLAGTSCGLPAAVGTGGEHGLSLPLCQFLLSPTLRPELRTLIPPELEAGEGREEKTQRAGELLLDL